MVAPQPTDIERAVAALTREFGATEVWLFGSAATGVATEHSDIDLLVVRPARANSPRPSVEARLCLSRAGLRRPFDLLVLTPERWQEARHRPTGVYEEIVNHGVPLHER
ncbi:MAG: nucleotidyltransferase domain-containing protein [Verrucomicrobia bacterium]|nr:nucleotidyltransferase domain-containing protein [Verrucomicrobiota bacterium]